MNNHHLKVIEQRVLDCLGSDPLTPNQIGATINIWPPQVVAALGRLRDRDEAARIESNEHDMGLWTRAA